jgi:ribosomal protein S17E
MSKLKEILKTLFPEKAADIEKLPSEEPPASTAPGTIADNKDIEAMKNLVATMKAENDKLLKELTEVKTKDQERNRLLEEKAKSEKTASIEAIIKKAIEDKKIPAKNDQLISHYKTILDKDLEAGKSVVDNLTPIASQDGTGAGKPATPPASTGMKSPLAAVDTNILKAVTEFSQQN